MTGMGENEWDAESYGRDYMCNWWCSCGDGGGNFMGRPDLVIEQAQQHHAGTPDSHVVGMTLQGPGWGGSLAFYRGPYAPQQRERWAGSNTDSQRGEQPWWRLMADPS